jgi:hypothetical protein
MIKIIKTFLIVIFTVSFTLQANSETSYITKKDKTKNPVVKKAEIEKKENQWIKKKNVKEKKKKFKEKIKDSKSWITKKSKEKIKNIKNNLKKYKDIDALPKAEYYFSGVIEPKENENAIYLYGYVNADTNSKKFKFKNKFYYSNSDGIAFLDDGKTTCKVDSQVADFLGDMMGKVVVKCSNKIEMTGTFVQLNNSGKGIEGETNKGNNVEFEFYSSKEKTITKLDSYKSEETLITRSLPSPKNNKNIKLNPNGKYYALLIGNSEYNNWDNLISPTNDVKAIKKVLDKSYKFEKIITVFNGSKKEIVSAFKELSLISTPNDYVLIYYSGHGEIEAQQAYWVPKDGGKDWGNDDWISINFIDIYIRDKIKAHHIAVLVDSCYVGGKFKGLNLLDNMTEEDSKIFAKQLVSDLNSRSRSVLSSGSNGPVSDTVAGTNHSRFALTFLNLLKEFEKSSIPVNLKSVAWNMDRYFAGTSQRPHYYHPPTWIDGGGDFIFIPKKNFK